MDSIGEELAGWGKVALVETVGRVSGAAVTAAVGFVEDDDGTLHVAAGSESSDWALNLRAQTMCSVTIGDQVLTYDAVEEEEGDRGRTISQLILKYGTPAEKLGHGPTFRLVPTR
jgi:deazaflavin-dependent oxidoreductase (nitroreductase family)